MSWDDHETCRRCGARECRGGAECTARVDAQKARSSNGAPMYQRKRDGRLFEVVIQARSLEGPITLRSVDEPRETVETTNDKVLHLFESTGRGASSAAPRPLAKPTPAVLAYGSDNAGGVHLCVGDARVHLTHAEALDLARGIEREANLPPSPMKGISR